MRVVLLNAFHHTRVVVEPELQEGGLYLDPETVREARALLCPEPRCHCGDAVGGRPWRWTPTLNGGAFLYAQ